jgi:hypothetical protein
LVYCAENDTFWGYMRLRAITVAVEFKARSSVA